MPQSLHQVYIHFVFTTKHRAPDIGEQMRVDVSTVLNKLAQEDGHDVLALYVMPDHCHILLRLNPDRTLADTMRLIKAKSSYYIHKTLNLPEFGWQNGYSAYSVSRQVLDTVKRYIRNQPRHHAKRTLQEEIDWMESL